MHKFSIHIFLLLFLSATLSFGQGKLFIIGGGERPKTLIEEMVSTADFKPNDYTVILLMSTSVPEESFSVIKEQISVVNNNPIIGYNFTKDEANNNLGQIDSVRNAKLIYIVGGDQNKFMEVVTGSRLYEAMHDAYSTGSTIAGTSAGAAIMSEIMITGSQNSNSVGNFTEVKSENVVTASGMGFLKNIIIDQHFIKRSRYNRLLSVLTDYPAKTVIGIDESTAIVVKGKWISVVGESQVVVVSNPRKLKKKSVVSFTNAKLSLLARGDRLKIKV